jgi:hypothetical protein
MLAQGGDDVVLARDGGPDTVNCGPGADRATVDPGGIDAVTRAVAASLKGPRRQKLVRGVVTLRLGCPVLLRCSSHRVDLPPVAGRSCA